MLRIQFLFAFCTFLFQTSSAQLTLIQSFYEQAPGDIISLVPCDSNGYVPKQSGANQTWDFSSCSALLQASSSNTWVIPASIPQSSLFPGATAVEIDYGNTMRFYKSGTSPAQFEYLGLYDPSVVHTYTNTWLTNTWPFSFGNTFTDSWSGTITYPSNPGGSFTGTTVVEASGSGNLILPGGAFYSNVLQVKRMDDFVMSIPSGSLALTPVYYAYYHSSSKYPLLTVNYLEQRADIMVNQSVAVGLTDYNLDATFAIYPNPAKSNFNVSLSNTKNEAVHLEIYSLTGDLIKSFALGNSQNIEYLIPVNSFSPGIYIVKTFIGQKPATRKLVVE